MASTTLSVEADAVGSETGIGAGAGNHLPVGVYGGQDYRAAMRFPVPAGWQAWTNITKATLTFYISDHQHVAPKNSSIYLSRMTPGTLWTKSAGTQNCESGFSGGNNTQYPELDSVSTDRMTFSSGSTANAAKSIVVTTMVKSMWSQNFSKIVFIFDNNGADQYTEIWSDEKSGYNATLVIEYEVQSAPVAPTLTGPTAGAVSGTDTPTLSWTHSDPQGDAQAQANVQLWDAAGTTLLATYNVPNANQFYVTPALTRGATYQWCVQTSDALTGFGPYSAKQSFSIKANPVVTISSVRKMVYSGGAPRLVVDWTTDQPQATYRVTAPGYDSGVKSGADTSHTLSTLGLVNGTPVTVTVAITNTDGAPLADSDSRAFTPRWGLTTHKKTLAGVPANWQTPVISSNVPAGSSLVIEYGSAATAGAGAPTAWYPSIASVPKTQYLWYRVWFIPSATLSPTLHSIDIPFDQTVAVLDKWGGSAVWPWQNPGAIPARFSVDTGESVYGTRSLRCDPDGVTQYHIISSNRMKVREGRSYILSGLMRSQGLAWPAIQLQNDTTAFISTYAPSTAGLLDWARYKTNVWVAPADMDVFVICFTNGPANGTAWWDGIKLEESIVATPWNPASVGATTLDAGGVQIDATKGGIFRYKGGGGLRDIVEGMTNGLLFGGDTAVLSPVPGTLRVAAVGAYTDALRVGDDAELFDVNIADSLGIRSATVPAAGRLYLGGNKSAFIERDSGRGDGWVQLGTHVAVQGVFSSSERFAVGGSAFPGGPWAGVSFFRTDQNMWYFFDGTRWLSSTLFEHQVPLRDMAAALAGIAATTPATHRGATPPQHSASDIWVEQMELTFYVVNGTALSASHSWYIAVQKVSPAGAGTVLQDQTVNSGAVNTYRRLQWGVSALLGGVANWPIFLVNVTKTGTPGNLLLAPVILSYRLVG